MKIEIMHYENEINVLLISGSLMDIAWYRGR